MATYDLYFKPTVSRTYWGNSSSIDAWRSFWLAPPPDEGTAHQYDAYDDTWGDTSLWQGRRLLVGNLGIDGLPSDIYSGNAFGCLGAFVECSSTGSTAGKGGSIATVLGGKTGYITQAQIRLRRYSSPTGSKNVRIRRSTLTSLGGADANYNDDGNGLPVEILDTAASATFWMGANNLPGMLNLISRWMSGYYNVIHYGMSHYARMYGAGSGSGYEPLLKVTLTYTEPVLSIPSIPTPSEITEDEPTFTCGKSTDAGDFIAQEDLKYRFGLSFDNGSTWTAPESEYESAADTPSKAINLKTVLSLAPAQYYLNAQVKVRVRAHGIHESADYYSGYSTSNAFTVNYRIAPDAPSSLTPSDATPYEGQSITFSIGRPSAGETPYHTLDQAGLTEGIQYFVQLADGTVLANVDTDVSVDLTATGGYTVGNFTVPGVKADLETTIKAYAQTHKNGDNTQELMAGAFISGISFTVKRFRAPIILITGTITRPAADSGAKAVIPFTVSDTGYGAQLQEQIDKIYYQINGGSWNVADISWTGSTLSGTFDITGLTPATAYSLKIKCKNVAPTGLTGQESAEYGPLTITSFRPGFAVLYDPNADPETDEAPMMTYHPAAVVGSDPDTPVNKGCTAIEKDIIINSLAEKAGQPISPDENGKLVDGLEFSGDNTSGYYKYADGRLECYYTKTFTNVDITSTWGGVYFMNSSTNGVAFPVPFTRIEYENARVMMSDPSAWVAYPYQAALSLTYWSNYLICSENSRTGVNGKLYMYAKGRWK